MFHNAVKFQFTINVVVSSNILFTVSVLKEVDFLTFFNKFITSVYFFNGSVIEEQQNLVYLQKSQQSIRYLSTTRTIQPLPPQGGFLFGS